MYMYTHNIHICLHMCTNAYICCVGVVSGVVMSPLVDSPLAPQHLKELAAVEQALTLEFYLTCLCRWALHVYMAVGD